MVTDPEVSAQRFFERGDPEKQFLLKQIRSCDDPDATYDNFMASIAQVNRNQYKQFKDSGAFVIERKEGCEEETVEILAKHFKLE